MLALAALAICLALTDLADGRARPHLATGGTRSSLLAIPLLVLAVAIGCYVACEVGVSNLLVRFLAEAPAATATSALGLYWAGGIEARIAIVAIVMVAAVNVLALSMILRLRRGERRR